MNEISILQGESINWEFFYADSEGTPMNIEYYVVTIAARERLGAKRLLFSYSTDVNEEITKTDIVNGATNVVIKDTTSFKPGKYILEMKYTHDSGMVSKPDQVLLTIHEGIS